MIDVIQQNRTSRTRTAIDPFQALPGMKAAQRALLTQWARGDAETRRWDTLRTLAGTERLDLADQLLELLLEHGIAQVDERFRDGRWRPTAVRWVDLERLQRELGIAPAVDREERRRKLLWILRDLGRDEAWARDACDSCRPSLPLDLLEARYELLMALDAWRREERTGMRQDFALFARPHTKAITESEWQWLDDQLDLAALDIQRFAPLLWLAGSPAFDLPAGRVQLGPLPLAALPCAALDGAQPCGTAPARYWLIENRASFERQARMRDGNTCVVWLPGRPSGDWLQAMARLLAIAPAAADISCDPDPAGIEIALTAGALWDAAGQPWQAHRMGAAELAAVPKAKTLPLTSYDHGVLERLGITALPPALAELRETLMTRRRKAEQEGWL